MHSLKLHHAWLACGLLVAISLAACGKTVNATMDDATITTRVRTALLNEPGLVATQINVNTNQHVVTLSGQVKNADDRQLAVEVARRTSGVADVRSELQIAP